MHFTALWSHLDFCKGFYTKVFPLLKNGQKKCPKTKTQNTFVQKPLHLLYLTAIIYYEILFIILLPYIVTKYFIYFQITEKADFHSNGIFKSLYNL